jgi:hypothetical protein
MRGPGLLSLPLALALLVAAAPARAQPNAPAAQPLAPAPQPLAVERENTRAACTDHLDNDGDGHVDCDDQDCQDFTFCAQSLTAPARAESIAVLRGRGTTRVVVGAVLLSLGVVLGGVSAVLWIPGAASYQPFDGNADYQVAVSMDVVGVAMIGAGTTLLAIGAGNLAEARRPRLALEAAPGGIRLRF